MKHELRVGMPAPDFELMGLDGHPVKLSDCRGRKLLLAFLRNARCAVCNLWVHETSRLAVPWRDRGLSVIAVFESSADKLRAQFEGREPAIAIAADPDGRAHELFGSRSEPERVQAVVSSGSGEAALRRAAAAGFAPEHEDGANFFRIPVEILVDASGVVRVIHRANEVVNHMPRSVIEDFLASGPRDSIGAA